MYGCDGLVLVVCTMDAVTKLSFNMPRSFVGGAR